MKRSSTPVFNASLFSGSEKAVRTYQKKYAAGFRPGDSVLELGCGPGVFLELLRERSVRSTGIDHSDSMVAECVRKKLNAVKADALQFLQRTKTKYDGIFCAHLIEHLRPEQAIRLFRLAHGALKPGGRFIVITPNVQDIHVWGETFWLDISHVRPYPLPLLGELVRFAGFEVVKGGTDADTGIKPGRRNFFRYVLYKLRFGAYYGRGDTFVIGQKKA